MRPTACERMIELPAARSRNVVVCRPLAVQRGRAGVGISVPPNVFWRSVLRHKILSPSNISLAFQVPPSGTSD